MGSSPRSPIPLETTIRIYASWVVSARGFQRCLLHFINRKGSSVKYGGRIRTPIQMFPQFKNFPLWRNPSNPVACKNHMIVYGNRCFFFRKNSHLDISATHPRPVSPYRKIRPSPLKFSIFYKENSFFCKGRRS